MINIETITANTASNETTLPMSYELFEHHMNYVISALSHAASLNALYASDPMYFGSSATDPSPSIDHILSLLSYIFNLPEVIPQEIPSLTPFTILDVWVYNMNCGTNCFPGSYIDHEADTYDTDHRAPDLSTLPDLYNYILYVYNRQKGNANET